MTFDANLSTHALKKRVIHLEVFALAQADRRDTRRQAEDCADADSLAAGEVNRAQIAERPKVGVGEVVAPAEVERLSHRQEGGGLVFFSKKLCTAAPTHNCVYKTLQKGRSIRVTGQAQGACLGERAMEGSTVGHAAVPAPCELDLDERAGGECVQASGSGLAASGRGEFDALAAWGFPLRPLTWASRTDPCGLGPRCSAGGAGDRASQGLQARHQR